MKQGWDEYGDLDTQPKLILEPNPKSKIIKNTHMSYIYLYVNIILASGDTHGLGDDR